MSKRLVLVVAVALTAGLAAGATIAVGQGGSSNDALHARLSGADTDGKGSAGVVIDGRRVCLAIAFSDLDTVAAAHIHRGARGQDGPIVVDPRFAGGRSGSANTLGRCVTVAQNVARAIRRNPGGYYVNVHTTRFPAGAIRGQLAR